MVKIIVCWQSRRVLCFVDAALMKRQSWALTRVLQWGQHVITAEQTRVKLTQLMIFDLLTSARCSLKPATRLSP